MAETKKQAFDKIRSVVERQELFEQAIREQSAFTCKFEGGDDLVSFRPEFFENEMMRGRTAGPTKYQGQQSAIGNFAVGQDRFFFNGNVLVKGEEVYVPAKIDVFKLERRKTMRVIIPAGYVLPLNITELNGRPVFEAATIVDASAGGIRFYMPGNRKAEGCVNGTKVKGVLHLPSGKALPFDGDIRHVQTIPLEGKDTAHLGVEFGQCRESVFQRMTVLTLDIQKKAAQD